MAPNSRGLVCFGWLEALVRRACVIGRNAFNGQSLVESPVTILFSRLKGLDFLSTGIGGEELKRQRNHSFVLG